MSLKRLYCSVLLFLLIFSSGCQSKVNIIDSQTSADLESNNVNTSSVNTPGNLNLNLSGNKGEMTYELLDAYITNHPVDNGLDIDYFMNYTYINQTDEDNNILDIAYPDFFSDIKTGQFIEGCRMFVCKIKVTNINAVYDVDDMYESPYIFRADNLFLNYIDEGTDLITSFYKSVDYYSMKKDGDHDWSTYELKPGESLIYEVGFVIGNAIWTREPEIILNPDKDKFYLGNTSGSADGEYYKISWEER